MSERPARASTLDPEVRQNLLRDTALDLGRRWFATWRDDLSPARGASSRGGFPGRLAEARALVAAAVGPAFAKRRLTAVTDEELGWAVHATYDEAKRAWLTSK